MIYPWGTCEPIFAYDLRPQVERGARILPRFVGNVRPSLDHLVSIGSDGQKCMSGGCEKIVSGERPLVGVDAVQLWAWPLDPVFRVFVVETAARLPRLAIIAVVRVAA
jgi:hypothetical protein